MGKSPNGYAQLKAFGMNVGEGYTLKTGGGKKKTGGGRRGQERERERIEGGGENETERE